MHLFKLSDTKMNLNIKDTFIKELPADSMLENSRRQVEKACFSFVTPKKTTKPETSFSFHDVFKTFGTSMN